MYVIYFLLAFSLYAADEDFSGKDSMNDIAFSDYKNFAEKWSLVTIRYRKDTGEMRLTYANELALKTLKSGSTKYPDGAVFAKTGIHTGIDPQFVSSVVPRGIRRYQFMVRNKSKYTESNGWGYGLFDANGKTFPESPKATQEACFACHTIVENRGDVFSEPFDFIHDAKFPAYKKAQYEQVKFEWIKTSDLPSTISTYVDKNLKQIRLMKHAKIEKAVFQGTLDELKPILQHETRSSKTPAVFMSHDKKRFVLVTPKKSEECMDMGSFEIVSTDLQLKPIVEKFCTHD